MKHSPILSSLVVLLSSFSLFSSLGCSGSDAAPPSGACADRATCDTSGAAGSSAGAGGTAGNGGAGSHAGDAGSAGTAGTAGSGGAGGAGSAGTAGSGGSAGLGGAGAGGSDPSGSPCQSAADCVGAFDADCISAECNAGQCAISFVPMGTAIADDLPGDCHVPSCDGEGHISSAVNGQDTPQQIVGDCNILSCNGFGQVVSKADDSDLPDDANDCTEDHCALGVASSSFSVANTPCGQISGVCTGTGICGVCVPDAFSCQGGQAQRCSNSGLWASSSECGGLGCTADACVQPSRVVVGTKHTCALLTDGTVRCWGDNARGQIGADSWVTSKNIPFKIGSLSGVTDLGAGELHACALTNSGNVYCWGDNTKGQVGIGSSTPSVFLPHLVTQNATRLFVGANTTCVMRSSGGSLCWGDNTAGLADADVATTTLTSPIAGISHANPTDSFSFGATAGCTTHQGSLSCWGTNSFGILSPVPQGSVANPTWTNAVQGASQVSVGAQFGCAVVTGFVKCWGSVPMLASGTVSVSQQFPTLVAQIADAVVVESGAASACAIRSSGQALCWGDNPSHAFGASEAAYGLAQPLTLDLPSSVTSVAPPKGAHACFVADGKAYCAGSNTSGQLGNGSVLPQPTLSEVIW